MVSVLSSAQLQPIYKEKALGGFFWEKHQHEQTVSSIKLTILPVFQALSLSDGSLRVQLLGRPIASLGSQIISDKINQGPFIDLLSYSLKPQEKDIVCLGDSCGGTPIREITFSNTESASATIGLQANSGLQDTVAIVGRAANGGVSVSSSSTQQFKSSEFEQKERVKGHKRMLFFTMAKCYKGDTALPYDTKKVETIGRFKHSVDAEAVANYVTDTLSTFIPVNFIANGIKKTLDKVYVPPIAAQTSIGANWSVDYALQGVRSVEFEWVTEVRTVFACYSAFPKETGLRWIKVLHQIKERILVTISEDRRTTTLESLEREQKLVGVSGYREHVFGRYLLGDDSHEEIAVDALKQLTISDI